MNDAQSVFNLFDQLKIKHKTVTHVALNSAQALAQVDAAQWEFPVKNFFVYDKKKNFYLITVRLDTPPVDLKKLAKTLGARGSFSFAKAEDLATKLKVRPGSVTPYAIFNDHNHEVNVVLDARLKEATTISAHPLRNDQTTTISTLDLNTLYGHTGHTLTWATLPFKT